VQQKNLKIFSLIYLCEYTIYNQKMEQFNHSMNDLPTDLLLLVISKCSDLSKFVLHFVSKKFRLLTLDNKINRDLGTSFIMCFVHECKSNDIKKKLCELAARGGSLSILKWFRFNEYDWNANVCGGAAYNGARF
jgi:hypothetical protein